MVGFDPDFADAPLPWPRAGDRLFVQTSEDRERLAWVAWPHDRWAAYAEGYRRAAVRLFEATNPERGDLDYVIYPLVYLWRHYLELILKALLPPLRYLADSSEQGVPHRHGLRSLWGQARPLLEQVGGCDPTLDIVGAIILELDEADPAGEAFRYPVRRDGSNGLPPSMHAINIRHLHEVMTRVATFFEGCETGVDVYVEGKSEYEADMRALYGDLEPWVERAPGPP